MNWWQQWVFNQLILKLFICVFFLFHWWERLRNDSCPKVLQDGATETWITPYKRYLTDGLLPAEPMEAKIVKRNAGRYTLIDGNLFRHAYTHPILTCVSEDQCARIMVELHEGICCSQ